MLEKYPVAAVLLFHEANPEALNKKGLSPLALAIKSSSENSLKFVKLLTFSLLESCKSASISLKANFIYEQLLKSYFVNIDSTNLENLKCQIKFKIEIIIFLIEKIIGYIELKIIFEFLDEFCIELSSLKENGIELDISKHLKEIDKIRAQLNARNNYLLLLDKNSSAKLFDSKDKITKFLKEARLRYLYLNDFELQKFIWERKNYRRENNLPLVYFYFCMCEKGILSQELLADFCLEYDREFLCIFLLLELKKQFNIENLSELLGVFFKENSLKNTKEVMSSKCLSDFLQDFSKYLVNNSKISEDNHLNMAKKILDDNVKLNESSLPNKPKPKIQSIGEKTKKITNGCDDFFPNQPPLKKRKIETSINLIPYEKLCQDYLDKYEKKSSLHTDSEGYVKNKLVLEPPKNKQTEAWQKKMLETLNSTVICERSNRIQTKNFVLVDKDGKLSQTKTSFKSKPSYFICKQGENYPPFTIIILPSTSISIARGILKHINTLKINASNTSITPILKFK